MIQKFEISDSNWDNIISEFNQIYNQKVSLLKERFPMLTKNDIITLILIWYNIDIQDSALLLNIEKGTVYHRRKIIKERLQIREKVNLEKWLNDFLNLDSDDFYFLT